MDKKVIPPIFTLHRYFMAANRMRELFQNALRGFDFGIYADKPFLGVAMLHADEPGIFMSYWYGGIHVVIEGWRELGLSEPHIDALLQSPHVETLRRYRNATFHFQADFMSQKHLDFMRDSQSSVAWVRELTSAFSNYFLATNQQTPGTTSKPPMPGDEL
jgi:hypothetical protein